MCICFVVGAFMVTVILLLYVIKLERKSLKLKRHLKKLRSELDDFLKNQTEKAAIEKLPELKHYSSAGVEP